MLRLALATLLASAALAQPIRLHPANAHYFEFRGKPTVLVTSGEHYGAVLNTAFDYRKYLDTLAADGLNYTRIFTGNYRENPGAFNIARNTLGPALEQFIAPWPRKGESFDLTQWNPAFFVRLKDFMTEAEKRGIVVEVTLFCPFYSDSMWPLSPMYRKDVPRTEVYTLKHAELQKLQETMVRKYVAELNGFDNFFWEIANEPYFGGITLAWQRRIAEVIVDAERPLPKKHLIAQNIANNWANVTDPDPNVSLFNFHYARPPLAVSRNWHLNKPIGYDETGFDGTADWIYRIQAWDFLLAGGALFNNLDYSFTVGHEDGTFAYPGTQPGGGSVAYRKQLATLKRFMDSLDFVNMRPDPALVLDGPADASVRALTQSDRAHALYIHQGRVLADHMPSYVVQNGRRQIVLALNLAKGVWRVQWLDPKTGKIDLESTLEHPGGRAVLSSPEYREDVALDLRRQP
ncbi:MAG TPA: hypothetical protein DEH78_21675 [Solibacterales bacterium]|nr:hypothetical protein [Bryobacterales bacterium]